MQTGHKRRGAAVAALLLLGATAVVLRSRHAAHHRATGETFFHGPRDVWTGFESGSVAPGVAHDAGPLGTSWAAPQVSPEQVEGAITAWREAILHKNADTVIALDRAFSLFPGRYGPEMVKLAEKDPEERIRAFSTRVLGKMKNVALVDELQNLMTDKSPFVRQNAAWSLGELSARPGGKEAALQAYDDLRQAEDTDADEAVRRVAADALKRLQ
jgi:hypothetical protein